MQSTFVQNSSGSWDLFVNNEPFGVTFEVPDGYTMMPYKFFLSNDDIKSVKPCKDVVFVLDEPDKMGTIVIDAEANTRFLNGLKIKVEGTLTLGKNFNLALSRNSQKKNPKMPKFNDLIIKNNENTMINFEDRTKKLNSRELYQLSKDGVYPYSRNMVQNNANLNLSLAVDTKSIYIAENMDAIKRNISLSFGQAGYIFLRLARLNSDARDSTLTIDSDIIKLEESILNITGNNSFVMRNDNDKPTVIDSEYVKDMELNFDGTNVTIDAQTVNNNGVIKNADIRYSDLKNINGILTNDLFNCKANNVTFEKESYVKYGPPIRDVKGRWLELENVVLKEGAFLKLYDYSNQESPLKKFSNLTVEGGVDINNNVDYTIESSILKSGEMEIKAGDKIDKVVIDNSILEGDNVLYNVSELSCSEVRDSEISLNKPTKISNQLLSCEDVDDYEAYQRAQEPKLEEPKRDVGQITTEDWKVL